MPVCNMATWHVLVCVSMKTISYFQVAVWKHLSPGRAWEPSWRSRDQNLSMWRTTRTLFPALHHRAERELEFREYATMLLRSGCCVMALDGSTVVGACLNRPLTRGEVMLNSVPPSVGPGMNWHSICFQYQYVFQHVLLDVSDKEWGEQFVATRDTKVLWSSQGNDFDLDRDLLVGSQMVSFVLNSNWCSLS